MMVQLTKEDVEAIIGNWFRDQACSGYERFASADGIRVVAGPATVHADLGLVTEIKKRAAAEAKRVAQKEARAQRRAKVALGPEGWPALPSVDPDDDLSATDGSLLR